VDVFPFCQAQVAILFIPTVAEQGIAFTSLREEMVREFQGTFTFELNYNSTLISILKEVIFSMI
jgi:hypothetical protein